MEEHSYQLIDGKAVAEQIKKELAAEVDKIKQDGRKAPHLVAILVGHDGGSEAYVANKVRNCEEIGLRSSLIRFEDDVTEQALLDKVNELNADDDVDGLIVQMPLPKHISSQRVIEAIDYRKDVDGFHPINVGRMSMLQTGHTRGHYRVAAPLRDPDEGQTLRHPGPQQHCRQTDGDADDAEGESG